MSKWRILAEIALIFTVFFIQGAWPVPDVNEPHYLGKTIHYWNPAWAAGDFFLESKDTHKVFYFTFGWLSLCLTPTALAWTGRLITWWLLAWSWRRLSFSVLPRPGWSILTAALFAMLMDRFHMAGEWVVGGVEAKGFAYVFVFLGVEALVRNRWNRTWLFLGAASAFHVIAGGWATVAAGLAWLLAGRDRPRLWTMWPALVGGFLLALPGLMPAVFLNIHADVAATGQANQIYVFERLPHHLDIFHIEPGFIARFVLLTVLFFALSWKMSICNLQFTINNLQSNIKRLRAFVLGAIYISLAGVAINMLVFVSRDLAAGLLRFYWFRLADVAVPLGVAMFGCLWIIGPRPAIVRFAAVLVGLTMIYHFGVLSAERIWPGLPRADRLPNALAWREACLWAADEHNVPPTARFITPRPAQTFKWYAGRAEVATWKDLPQDAPEIVGWWSRLQDLFGTGNDDPDFRWHKSLNELTPQRLEKLGKKYQAGFLITDSTDPPLILPVVYRNEFYIIYRL